METSIDIFDASKYGDGLVNVVTGNNDLSVNFDDRIHLGEDR